MPIAGAYSTPARRCRGGRVIGIGELSDGGIN
jgi:hypothetical protein